MPFTESLIVPVRRYGQYDGTNSADIIDHFTRPLDGNRHRFDVNLVSETGGVLTLEWEGGFRNPGNTGWEIYNSGTAVLEEGDYFPIQPEGSTVSSLDALPASLIGQEYAIVEAQPS